MKKTIYIGVIGAFAISAFAFNNPTLDPRQLPPRTGTPTETQKPVEAPVQYRNSGLKLAYLDYKNGHASIVTGEVSSGIANTNTTSSRGSIPIFQNLTNNGLFNYENIEYIIKIKPEFVELLHNGKVRVRLYPTHNDGSLEQM